jgi:hypothetical protein
VQAARRAAGYDEMGREIIDVTPEPEPEGDGYDEMRRKIVDATPEPEPEGDREWW